MENTKNKSKVIWVVLAFVLLLVIAVAGYFYSSATTTINVYRKIVTGTVKSAFDTQKTSKRTKTSVDMTLDCDIDLVDKELYEVPIIKTLKDTTLAFNVQTDADTNKTVLHIKSKYENEKLLDASIFMDLKESKAYLYAKDLMDNYLEFKLEEQETTTTEPTEEEKVNKIAMAKAEMILKEELSKIITEDMCTTEDGVHVLRTTSTKLIENLKVVLVELKANAEFLECYENPEEIKESLDTIKEALDTDLMEEFNIEVRMELSFLLKMKSLTVKAYNKEMEVVYTLNDEEVSFKVRVENEDVATAKVEVIDGETVDNIKVSVDIAELGKCTVNIGMATNEVEAIDEVDTSKVKDFNQLTMFDLMSLAAKLEEGKMGELIELYNDYNQEVIDRANEAVVATNVATMNDQLTLAYVDLKMEYMSVADFTSLKNITVEGKKYANVEAYYKAIVPEVDEKSTKYDIPEGYELTISANGSAAVQKKAASETSDPIIDKANQAIETTNLTQAQSLASLIWAEAYMDGLTGKALENKVKTELAKDGITEEKWNIKVTDKGVEITKK
ncbi:MAG: hypothetical protein IKL08_05050 [Clostridia bacterium]|nr:hypothetical protein [Clostridia bacterium]